MVELELSRNLQSIIENVEGALKKEKNSVGRSEEGRLLSIALTHLETARLFIRETEGK